mmetsp:Transcript_5716/g.11969  ORF Transcript_5716/g.11969 Transcript_5716/m.11969 type:complete len:229 (+) Transcript_5716:1335-2021(+)
MHPGSSGTVGPVSFQFEQLRPKLSSCIIRFMTTTRPLFTSSASAAPCISRPRSPKYFGRSPAIVSAMGIAHRGTADWRYSSTAAHCVLYGATRDFHRSSGGRSRLSLTTGSVFAGRPSVSGLGACWLRANRTRGTNMMAASPILDTLNHSINETQRPCKRRYASFCTSPRFYRASQTSPFAPFVLIAPSRAWGARRGARRAPGGARGAAVRRPRPLGTPPAFAPPRRP